jgi:hypothetical protein
VASPGDEQWDLVVVHTLHSGADYTWLESQTAVLDTTYRATDIAGRVSL